MADYLTTDTELASVANAIRTKGGTSASLVYPAGFVSAINDIPTGGGQYYDNDVIFWDGLANNGDGAIVYSCSASDFAAMTEFPANPDHSNYITHGISIPMTSQGWNISLSDAKTFVNKKKFLVIGQNYKPTDGKTHIVCYIDSANNTVLIGIDSSTIVNVEVDNASIEEKTGAFDVESLSVGWHDIKLTTISKICNFRRTSAPSTTEQNKTKNIREVYLDSTVYINTHAFAYCINLKTVSIPSDLIGGCGNFAFYECNHLTSITYKRNMNSSSSTSCFYNCYSLKYIADTLFVTNTSCFYNCSNLRQLCGLRNANTGTYPSNIFGTYGVEKVSLNEYLDIIQQDMFRYNYVLKYIVCPRTSPPTLQSGAFKNVNSDFIVYVPTGSKATYDAATNWASISSHIVEADW